MMRSRSVQGSYSHVDKAACDIILSRYIAEGPALWIRDADPLSIVVDHDVSEDDRFNISPRIVHRVDLVQLLFL